MDNSSLLLAKRLKSSRMLTSLTRTEFGQKTGISSATLRAWENPKPGRNGLTKKGAMRFLKALHDAGVECPYEWLMNGSGSGPKLINQDTYPLFSNNQTPAIDWGEEEAVLKEIQVFKDVNPDPVVIQIVDDGMQPLYTPGDYVGGKWKKHGRINECLNKNCIIHTLDGQILVRRITHESKREQFTISCINPNSTVHEPILYNTEILKAAPIIWHRKKEE